MVLLGGAVRRDISDLIVEVGHEDVEELELRRAGDGGNGLRAAAAADARRTTNAGRARIVLHSTRGNSVILILILACGCEGCRNSYTYMYNCMYMVCDFSEVCI